MWACEESGTAARDERSGRKTGLPSVEEWYGRLSGEGELQGGKKTKSGGVVGQGLTGP